MKIFIPISLPIRNVIVTLSILGLSTLIICEFTSLHIIINTIPYYDQLIVCIAGIAGISFGIWNSRMLYFISFTKALFGCTLWTTFCFFINFLDFNLVNVFILIGLVLGIFLDRSYLKTKQQITKELQEQIDSIGI